MLTAISRGIGFVGFSLKNVFYFILFIGVILVLFFIPEILKLDWSSFSNVSLKSTVQENVPQLASPLDELIQRIDSGYYQPAKPQVEEAAQGQQPAVEKKAPLPPFNPRVTIKKLEIIKIDGQASPKDSNLPLTNLRITGVAEGADIKKVEVLHDGNYMGKVPIDRPNSEGEREFFISKPHAYGEWTIHIEDKHKRVYEKTYSFFPQIDAYPKDNDIFQVRHTVDGLDPRIEKRFTVNEKVPGRENSKGFV